jgi:hypothetical protein
LNQWWWNSRGYTPAGIEAWFGIRINTLANSRTAFSSLRGKAFPIYLIPLKSGMSIGMALISVELFMMLCILLFIPGDYAGPCFIGFAIGESLGAAALGVRNILLPFLSTLTLLAFWRALESTRGSPVADRQYPNTQSPISNLQSPNRKGMIAIDVYIWLTAWKPCSVAFCFSTSSMTCIGSPSSTSPSRRLWMPFSSRTR